MKKIALTIIVYNRINNVEEWIRCFKLCNNEEAELIIIHNCDDLDIKERCSNLCKIENIRYVPRNNVGYDIGALQDVCRERLEGFPNNWQYLFWITDDVYPMNKDFIIYFMKKQQESNNGITCLEISKENREHVRTSGFIISKELSLLIEFPDDPVSTKSHCYQFEFNSKNSLIDQIERLNRRIVQVSSDLSSSYLWDTHHRHQLNRWDEFHKIFPK